MEFGYNPPAGDRGLETIVPRDYLGDLHRSLDVASQGFSSPPICISFWNVILN